MCTTWWLLLFLFHCFLATLPGFQVPESPGTILKCQGLTALHPVVLVPGIVTGGLELWEGKPCAGGLFRKRLWGGSFTETFKRPLCWLEHMSLHNETGLDPPEIRVRAVPGLVGADYFTPGYFVWAVLIENLAKIGYEGKNLYMAAYDWRLSFQNTEVRDQTLSRLKSKIELMYRKNGNKKVVVVPHSMGTVYFLHFLKWVETDPPVGGGRPGWCVKNIKAIMNIGPTFLGVPKTVTNLIFTEAKDIASVRAMDLGVLNSKYLGLQTLEHVMRMCRTWDSIMSLLPKGRETIWGKLDWLPEEGHVCNLPNKKLLQFSPFKYGRMISFGKEAFQLPSSQINVINYNDKNASNKYTAESVIDLLRYVAPKIMQRAEGHFSHGIADDLDDPKYAHYKYWSNPLETKLPDVPDLEIYCLYGVGIPTERSFVYKQSTDRCRSSRFRIDNSVDGDEDSCLKGGVCFVDGDESVPVMSAGFMCAKGWRGRTRFNPSGIATYVREYRHKAPARLLEGRGTESGAHVDILGNVGLIEDILRVAAGSTGAEIGGDRIHSNILSMSDRINLWL
ncbi:hypothetical protein K2173_014026 [Erythroxylum novogranatense]|uniref:Phospholipid:diacylglycerol acyltransferase 2 n=1 Tax=Erythroxylum novogranatense TaxID=1862640 RepID=A0AAV8SD22_9ROSI|nr:hypothetical protein K2173_014026 [Erythroxylum novogranatense]